MSVELKAKCLQQNNTRNGSNATFVVEAPEKENTQPRNPGQVNARRAVQVNFDDDTARQFVPGREYTITIE